MRIDCDIHPAVGGTRTTLLPYLDNHWKEQVVSRAIDGLDLNSYPPNMPFCGRADWRPKDGSKPGSDLAMVQRGAFDHSDAGTGADVATWRVQPRPMEANMTEEMVKYSKENGIATITLNRPDKANTLRMEVIVDAGRGRALDLCGKSRDRQAALLVFAHLGAPLDNDRVHHDQRLLRLLVAGRVHDDQPAQDADLRCGKADAGRVVHGRQHVSGKLQELGVDALDRRRLLAQDRVRDGDDGENCHMAADIGLAGTAVNMFLF